MEQQDTLQTFVITKEQHKRLLHAYETLMFAGNRAKLTPDEKTIFSCAWSDITNILLHDSLKNELHTGGAWEADEDLLNNGHWKAIL